MAILSYSALLFWFIALIETLCVTQPFFNYRDRFGHLFAAPAFDLFAERRISHPKTPEYLALVFLYPDAQMAHMILEIDLLALLNIFSFAATHPFFYCDIPLADLTSFINVIFLH